jgi:molybdopterin converting factor small subunit
LQITLRYYAAAQAAAGVAEERLEATDGASLADALEAALAVARVPAGGGTAPPLADVLRRCSFLVNEVAVKDRGRVLGEGDVVDVLPPFAGG